MARKVAEHNVTNRNARATAIVVAAGDCGHAQVQERGVVIASVTGKTILFGHALPGENPESLDSRHFSFLSRFLQSGVGSQR